MPRTTGQKTGINTTKPPLKDASFIKKKDKKLKKKITDSDDVALTERTAIESSPHTVATKEAFSLAR
jgi:hypothetical protein